MIGKIFFTSRSRLPGNKPTRFSSRAETSVRLAVIRPVEVGFESSSRDPSVRDGLAFSLAMMEEGLGMTDIIGWPTKIARKHDASKSSGSNGKIQGIKSIDWAICETRRRFHAQTCGLM